MCWTLRAFTPLSVVQRVYRRRSRRSCSQLADLAIRGRCPSIFHLPRSSLYIDSCDRTRAIGKTRLRSATVTRLLARLGLRANEGCDTEALGRHRLAFGPPDCPVARVVNSQLCPSCPRAPSESRRYHCHCASPVCCTTRRAISARG